MLLIIGLTMSGYCDLYQSLSLYEGTGPDMWKLNGTKQPVLEVAFSTHVVV